MMNTPISPFIKKKSFTKLDDDDDKPKRRPSGGLFVSSLLGGDSSSPKSVKSRTSKGSSSSPRKESSHSKPSLVPSLDSGKSGRSVSSQKSGGSGAGADSIGSPGVESTGKKRSKQKKIFVKVSDLKAPLTPHQKPKLKLVKKEKGSKPTKVAHKESFPQTPKMTKKGSIGRDNLDDGVWEDSLDDRKSALMFDDESMASASQLGSAPFADDQQEDTETKMYKFARECKWDLVLDEIANRPRDANCVSQRDGTTPLHLAVMSRTTAALRNGCYAGKASAPLEIIDALISAAPEAAIIRCHKNKYTPLAYACFVQDDEYDVEDAAEIVKILLRHAPQCVNVFTDESHSALDVHIVSYSRHFKEREEHLSQSGRPSSIVLRSLLESSPELADTRLYSNNVRGPIELLYRCNLDIFKEAVEENLDDGLSYVPDDPSNWWAWKWALILLEKASLLARGRSPFNAVHAASRLVGCPLPVLQLVVRSDPEQLKERDDYKSVYNLPLHNVCSWVSDSDIISGDRHILSRKCKAIEFLLDEYPEAARTTNNCGETPLQLAVETCTPWHGGLEMIARACPKALKFPKQDTSVDNRSKDSVGESQSSVDSSFTEETIDETIGMTPFLLAAITGQVSDHRKRQVSVETGLSKDDLDTQLAKKDVQSVRAIYGLLRMRPSSIEEFCCSY